MGEGSLYPWPWVKHLGISISSEEDFTVMLDYELLRGGGGGEF
jgi:hypothetical protein